MAQEDFQKLLSVNTAHCATQMQRRSLLSKVLVELAAAAQVLNTKMMLNHILHLFQQHVLPGVQPFTN